MGAAASSLLTIASGAVGIPYTKHHDLIRCSAARMRHRRRQFRAFVRSHQFDCSWQSRPSAAASDKVVRSHRFDPADRRKVKPIRLNSDAAASRSRT